jgi:hypothetical protein
MKRMRGNLTYSNVISTLCLVLLLGGGTAWAATRLPGNSVGTKQLKKEAVTPAKLSKAAKATLVGAQGPLGPQGRQGDKGDKGERGERSERGERGPEGPEGKPGEAGATDAVVRYGPEIELPGNAGAFASSFAECHAGEVAVGGGYEIVGSPSYVIARPTTDAPGVIVEEEEPYGGPVNTYPAVPAEGQAASGWWVQMVSSTEHSYSFRGYAVCASP